MISHPRATKPEFLRVDPRRPIGDPVNVEIECPACKTDLELQLIEESFDEDRRVRIWIGTGRCICGRIVCATGYYGLRILRLYTIASSGRRSPSVEFLRQAPLPKPGR